MLSGMYREIEALGGAPIMDAYDEGHRDALEAALAVLRKHGFGVDLAPGEGWQDIDSAPRDGTHILLYVKPDEHREKDVGVDVGFYVTHRDDDFWAWSYVARPTHWMPLPSPPEAEA